MRMKRKWLLSSVMLLIALCGNLLPVNAATAHISVFVQNGAVRGDGSKASPFGSFDEARDYIRQIKKEGAYPAGGITVNFRAGDYLVSSEGLTLTGEDAGLAGAPVVYRAYANEEVRFVGGVSFDLADFQKVTDPAVLARMAPEAASSIVALDLKSKGITDYGEMSDYGTSTQYFAASEGSVPYQSEQEPELFLNNEPMTIARYPNEGYVTTTGVVNPGTRVSTWTDWVKGTSSYIPLEERGAWTPFSFEWKNDRLMKYQQADQIRIHGFWGTDWCDLACGVASIDFANKVVNAALTDAYTLKENSRFYFYNLLEEIDMPGEYFLDRNTGILYFYPIANSGNVMFSMLNDHILTVTDTQNITFRGLTFTCGKKNGVSVTKSKCIDMELCSVSNVAAIGVEYQYTTDSTVISCHVYNCGKGGIYHEMNDVVSFVPSNMTIENNIVHNFSRLTKTYAPGVRTGGNYNKIIYNKVYDAPHYACVVTGHYNYVEYNEFFDCLKESDDAGVIYTGRSKQQRNNYIRNNYFHDIPKGNGTGRAAIYLDDGWDGMTITGNVFKGMDVGVWINGGRNNVVTDNIFIDIHESDVRTSAILLQFYENNYAGFEADFRQVAIDKVQLTDAYRDFENFANLLEDEPLVPKYNVVKNNIEYNCSSTAKDISLLNLPSVSAYTKDYIFANNTYQQIYSFDNDPGFEDYEAGNYCLRDNAEAYLALKDFKAPDFQHMGIYTSWMNRYSKDTISYLLNSPIVYNGMNPSGTDADFTVVPVRQGGKVYIPMRSLCSELGGTVFYDSEAGSAVFEMAGSLLTVVLDGMEICLNESPVAAADEVMNQDGTLMFSETFLKTILGLFVNVCDNGVIFISQDEISNGWEDYMVADMKRRLEFR